MNTINEKSEIGFFEEELKTSLGALQLKTLEYISLDAYTILNEVYDIVLSVAIDENHKLDLIRSLKIAYELSLLKMDLNYIISVLLYYPIRSERLKKQYLTTPIKHIIANWLELYELQKHRKRQDNSEYWKNQTDIVFIRAVLQCAKSAENILIITLERLYELRFPNKKLVNTQLLTLAAEETLSVYSIIAEMLGIGFIKWQLDDESLKILQPRIYTEISEALKEKRHEREAIIKQAINDILNHLQQEKLTVIAITGRPKHIYGLYKKISEKNLTVNDVNDNLAIRIIVNEEKDCYQALAILSKYFDYAQGVYGDQAYRDWIKRPKPNNYQSIHTTIRYKVSDNDIRLLEVQIRTQKMHDIAEYGVAAHWKYRVEKNNPREKRRKQPANIVNLQKAFESYLELHNLS